MPATDYQGSSDPFASFGRSILSFRRDQVHATDGHHDPGSTHDLEIEVFQKHVADLFFDLASSSSSSDGSGSSTPSASAVADDVLSLSWLRKLLDTFLICLEEFRVILFNCGKGQQLLTRPSLDHYVSNFFDRAVKALDVCNAIRDGINQLRQWRLHLEIVLTALSPGNKALGEGQLHRARKALVDLTILMLDEKESGGSVINNRNRSFGRAGKVPHHRRSGSGGARGTSAGHYRSLSWSVSRTWSAARQLQAIGNNLSAPRANEVTATNGLALPIFTMSSVLLFVMWTLVAAIPCQDRGLQTHFSIPRTFQWAAPVMALHERIFEESKRKDRKNSCGLLKEILQIEKCTRQLIELFDPVEFPLSEEKEIELKQGVEELAEVCGALKEELDPLERQVREVFHRIVKSRTEGLDSLSRPHNME